MHDSGSSFPTPVAATPSLPFPVDAALPRLAKALEGPGRAVLTAAPGSGKTTRVPLALLGILPGQSGHAYAPLPGKILMLEPRRLAARAAARYMARMLGENTGQRVGYRVRLESRVSAQTRVELLTEGMFTRLLLADPLLSGVSCVIFDEFHERSLHADLGLAMCLECAEAYRPDLRILVMSATLDAEEISHFLGDCPIIHAKGRNWPVQVRYADRELCIQPGFSAREIGAHMARAVCQALRSEAGNLLAFLPGQAEIRLCAELLAEQSSGLLPNTDVYPLYGDLPADRQDAAIAPPPSGRRKVVLATDLAQTSLTIEGVRVVIDSGLARAPRFEPASGMSKLVTSRLAKDAADQRTGRAGRLESGLCIRLWSESEFLAEQTRPEILNADLASLYLEALSWGSDPASLPWLTAPPQQALDLAADTLTALKAVSFEPTVSASGKRPVLTKHGQKLASIPLHPRLGHMVLQASKLTPDLSSLAACLAAIVSERDPLRKTPAKENSADIRLRLPLLLRPENTWLLQSAKHIHRLSGLKSPFHPPAPAEENYSGALLSLAWPERIAQRRASGSFRLASGQGAELWPHDLLANEPFLAVASLGGPGISGMSGGPRASGTAGPVSGANHKIHLAAPLSREELDTLHAHAIQREDTVHWDARSEEVKACATIHLGALVLEEKPLAASGELAGRIHNAMLEGIRAMGLACLPWTEELEQLRARVYMLRSLEPDLWPDLSDEALLAALAPPQCAEAGAAKAQAEADEATTWLSPWLRGTSRRAQLASLDLAAALHALLLWPLPKRLEEEAPTRLPLPSGTTARVDYLPALRGEAPVLAVKLQEMFGQTDSPRLARGRVAVMLHLLSPAGRPLQVTGDLHHFWLNAYKQVRAEMRGRYPKHPWPEDPLTATPTGKTRKNAAK